MFSRDSLRLFVLFLFTSGACQATLTPLARGANDGKTIAVPVTGRIAAGREQIAAARKTLGDHGCLTIRSKDRCIWVVNQLCALGWNPPPKPNLVETNFDQQMLVLVYKNGDEDNAFSVIKYDESHVTPWLSVGMSYVIHEKGRDVVERCNFLFVVVPRQPKLTVTVATYHPQNNGSYPTPDKAQFEWRGTLGTESGDVADSLRGKVDAAQQKVKKGGDILVRFALERADVCLEKTGHFSQPVPSIRVWDGKYSNGYRNHAFEVRAPDGKTHHLRPKEILDWDKNAPHPVAIADDQPYVLPEWQVGQTHKSLRALGLDTSLPGKYMITGIYSESGNVIQWNGVEHSLWGGTIATNSIEVEVGER